MIFCVYAEAEEESLRNRCPRGLGTLRFSVSDPHSCLGAHQPPTLLPIHRIPPSLQRWPDHFHDHDENCQWRCWVGLLGR